MDELSMEKRVQLHNLLSAIVQPHKGKAYFQPPSSVKLLYPCIIYGLDNIHTEYANSIKYKNRKRYKITLIDRNPDSELISTILELKYSQLDRYFSIDNLNHYVFTIYY